MAETQTGGLNPYDITLASLKMLGLDDSKDVQQFFRTLGFDVAIGLITKSHDGNSCMCLFVSNNASYRFKFALLPNSTKRTRSKWHI